MTEEDTTGEAAQPPEPVDLAMLAIAGAVRDFRRRYRAKSQYPWATMDDALSEQTTALDEAVAIAREWRDRAPRDVEREAGSLDDLELLVIVARACLQLLNESHGVQPARDLRYVLVGLATRATQTMYESCILIENGFAFGSRAKWRTLLEVAVVLRMLQLGDRHTATRFKEHRWVAAAKLRSKSGYSEWPDGEASPEVIVKRLERRFGREFSQPYGWASNVARKHIGKARPNLSDLVALAGLERHLTRYSGAHQSVHGCDALGLLGSVSLRDGAFHAGASSEGVISAARDAALVFTDTFGLIVGLWHEAAPGPFSLGIKTAFECVSVDVNVNLGLKMLAADRVAAADFAGGWSESLVDEPIE